MAGLTPGTAGVAGVAGVTVAAAQALPVVMLNFAPATQPVSTVTTGVTTTGVIIAAAAGAPPPVLAAGAGVPPPVIAPQAVVEGVIVLVVPVSPAIVSVLSELVQATVPPVVVRVLLSAETRMKLEEVGTSTARDKPSVASTSVVAAEPAAIL
ncbi:MAG: hypothetical protein UU30_C0008G0010 [Candidatus Nomurabacteria bacterium GW2011_GWA2_40_97]|nr:MAG: hypothetical protein UU30_C0008G0010 [Candidatus Nomurabacteria bacterium GW2011_GWA2_40_97]